MAGTDARAVVERIIDCINRGDREGLAAQLHPAIEFRDRQRAPDTPEVVRGREAVVGVLGVWMDAFDGFRAEVAQYIAEGEWLLCPTTWRGTGKGSSVEIELVATGAYLCRDGLAVSAVFGNDSPEAARAAVAELG